MELFGLLFAVPVTFVTSLVYASLMIPAARRWPVAKHALLIFSGFVGACVLAEAVALGIWGAKGTYDHFRHIFTVMHFLNCLLAPPAVAHAVFYLAARVTSLAWLQFFFIVPCCWLACMAVIVGHIMIDEAIAGPDAEKPFYMTLNTGPNQIAAHNAGWPSQFRCSAFVHFGATGAGGVLWPGMCELHRWAT
jgi:hypothetical protein